jgi:hypothetical protein
MASLRIDRAVQVTGFLSEDKEMLQEALDVTKHLPLALVGDKVLDLLISLAYYHAGFSNSMTASLP